MDSLTKERMLEVMFPLDTEAGVSKLLYALPHVKEMRMYGGDYGACDLVVDIEKALANIRLTPSQRRIIDLHYHLDLTQVETVKQLEKEGFEITQQGVSDNLKTINRRLSKFHAEGIVVE